MNYILEAEMHTGGWNPTASFVLYLDAQQVAYMMVKLRECRYRICDSVGNQLVIYD